MWCLRCIFACVLCARKTFFSHLLYTNSGEVSVLSLVPHHYFHPSPFFPLNNHLLAKKKKKMDKTLIDYDKNLEELERQREQLEIVMQMMGQEWEER